ncbi:DUF6265 family protein [Lutibacter sp.]|uniref:DUF6265 family protein n=1 Tax=Lutibacter sp. TaxID=1925666 RepID=UPI001A294A39|nr:DUF6265 family protein [Lutibacter sp.]MBI9042424.1 hypothetical protein [Lutibacter sp.]
MKNYLAFLFCIVSVNLFSQNTLKFDVSKQPVKANIQQVSWIAGYWLGEAFDGKTEEVWTNPLGNSMMGSFKLVVENVIQFYELCTISEENETLVFRLKHFHNDLKGWEEKDEMIEAPLVKIENNKAYFHKFTFEKISETELNIYVLFEETPENETEMKFNYKLKG